MIINLSKVDFGGVATGGGNAKPEEVFDVQPTTTDQTITPTEGSVFSGGTVRAVTSDIDNNIVAGNIKEGVTILGVAGNLKEEKPEETFNVQPTTADQTITPTEGSVFSGGTVRAVTSAIDSNIVPENIKEGVSILGVAGTLSEGITPAGAIAINLNGTYDVTNYASAEVNVGDTPDYRYMNGTVDKAGLKAIGWTDEDILTYEQNSPHYTWQNDQFKVSDENKALYSLDDPNPESYKDNPNVTFIPKKNMESYFAKTGGFSSMRYIKGIPFFDTSFLKDIMGLFSGCRSLTAVPLLDFSSVIRADSVFSGCRNLTTVPPLDLSSATDVSYFFEECTRLQTAPLLDFSNVLKANSIFRHCTSLQTVPALDLPSATDVSFMFYKCSSLQTVPALDLPSALNASDLFNECPSLQTVQALNLSNATNVSSLFYRCTSLTTVPPLDLSSALNASDLFYGCSDLQTVPVLNLSSATDVSSVFSGCRSLTTVPPLNLSNATDVSSLFNDCSSLITIPSLDTSKATNISYMFSYCSSLTTVEGIDFSGLTSELRQLFGYTSNMQKITRFIVNGKINVSISDNYSIKALTAIDYDSVKSILAAADRTDNTNKKTLAFNRTMTDQNGELAGLVASCTSKGWTISGLTLQ